MGQLLMTPDFETSTHPWKKTFLMPEAKRMRDKRLIDMRTDIGGETQVDVIMMLKLHHSWIAGYIYTLSEGERREGGQIRQCT